jgi:hypothetical protein
LHASECPIEVKIWWSYFRFDFFFRPLRLLILLNILLDFLNFLINLFLILVWVLHLCVVWKLMKLDQSEKLRLFNWYDGLFDIFFRFALIYIIQRFSRCFVQRAVFKRWLFFQLIYLFRLFDCSSLFIQLAKFWFQVFYKLL